jgi:hypothetical protein
LRRFLADTPIAEWFSKPFFDAHIQDTMHLDVRIFKKTDDMVMNMIIIKY